MNSPALTGIEKLPKALVQLAATLVPATIGGVEPADDLPEGRVAGRLVDDRDPGRVPEGR